MTLWKQEVSLALYEFKAVEKPDLNCDNWVRTLLVRFAFLSRAITSSVGGDAFRTLFGRYDWIVDATDSV